jgi:hypothetical protein
MQSLFLVTSAIHTKYGVYSNEDRFNQTIKTLESIKTRAPSSKIILIESSVESPLTKKEKNILNGLVTRIDSYSSDAQVKRIYEQGGSNHDVVKNLTELLIIGQTLKKMVYSEQDLLKDVDQIFKLSGRYELDDKFDLNNFSNPNKYYFAKRTRSQFHPNLTGGLTEQFMSRLWSFNKNKIDMVFYRYNLMLEEFTSALANKQYKDTEHLLLKFFDGASVMELDEIGVKGNIGPNGEPIHD